MEIIYRKAKICDLDTLCNLWDKLDKSHVRYHRSYILTNKILEDRKRYIKKRLKKKNSFIYVAEYRKKVIGFIHGKIKSNPSIFKTKKIGSLDTFFIEKKYRRKRIGTELVRILLKEFVRRKLRFVRLTVDVHNSSAITFYRKFGFKDLQLKMIKDF